MVWFTMERFASASLLLVLGQGGAPVTDVDEIPLSLRVNNAIALGVEFLEARQQPDGRWRGQDRHGDGMTALAAFTLLKSGVPKGDESVRRALGALRGASFDSVYSAAVHLLLCEALRDPEWTQAAETSLDFLLATQDDGAWAYPWGSVDSSNTQFALLGLRAARHMGLVVPEGTLVAAAGALVRFEHPKGGFTYPPAKSDPYAGITAAGLASLAVLQEAAADSPRLAKALERLENGRERSEEWLERRFDPARNSFTDGSWWTALHFAYLWAVERWCGLAGRERLGGRDWYAEGAEWLVSIQDRDGAFGRRRAVEDTCFALLFLRRATVSRDPALAAIDAALERARETSLDSMREAGQGARRLVDWWLAGPWNHTGPEPLLLDPPFEPDELEPRANAKLARREWEPVTLRLDTWTDLELLTDRRGNDQLWVLATRLVVSGDEAQDVLLWLDLDDGWDVWLDGKSVSRERRRTLTASEPAVVPLELAPGPHQLAVLVEDRKGLSVFGALLASRENGAPPAEVVPEPLPAAKR